MLGKGEAALQTNISRLGRRQPAAATPAEGGGGGAFACLLNRARYDSNASTAVAPPVCTERARRRKQLAGVQHAFDCLKTHQRRPDTLHHQHLLARARARAPL